MQGGPPPRSLPQPGHVYDVAVIGAGLAGSELALRLADSGQDVLLVSQSLDSVGTLFHARADSPFPDGSLFEAARRASLPEAGGWALHRHVKQTLERRPGIHLLQSCVTDLEPGAPHRLSTWEGPPLLARTVVFAVGSFLNARLRVGAVEEDAGRLSEVAYDALWRNLAARGVRFAAREDGWSGEADSPPYTVRYETFDADEFGDHEAFALRRFDAVYAVGRCAPGELDYGAVIAQAHRLADTLARRPQSAASRSAP